LGQSVEVLVEGKKKGKWYGRTRANKLVFFEDGATTPRSSEGTTLGLSKGGDWRGKLVPVEITWTGPWSMQGRLKDNGE
jgi:tRNA-2-methylthio-N6-dimethylallyladenosine synthase